MLLVRAEREWRVRERFLPGKDDTSDNELGGSASARFFLSFFSLLINERHSQSVRESRTLLVVIDE